MDISPKTQNTQNTIHRPQKFMKGDQSVDTLILLRRGNKILMEGITEIKCGAETEGMTIQRLPRLRTVVFLEKLHAHMPLNVYYTNSTEK